MSEHLVAALAELTAKRDALNGVIVSLQGLIGAVPPTPIVLGAPMGARPPRPRKSPTPRKFSHAPRPRPVARAGQPRPPSTSTVSTTLSAVRDAAILACLKRNDGIAKHTILRGAMPKEPDLDAAQADDAYRNTMTRLKNKKLIDRTGDVWSLVGLGSERG